MAQQIKKGTTYVNYGTAGISQVTASNLNNHVDNAELLAGCISSQTDSSAQISDYFIIERLGFLYKYTLSSIRTLFQSFFVSLSGGTMTGELFLFTNTPTTTSSAASKGYVDTAISSAVSSSILVGSVVMWGGATPPAGWLEMNGQAAPLSLQPIYGATLPDLRGEFVRGWDNGRSVDAGRALKSAQGGSVESHRHAMFNQRGGNSDGGGPYTQGATAAGTTDQTGYYGGTETRPRNVALMYIVKT